MYSIGQVSEMFGIPVSTLRYYDKEGLFPNLERSGSTRRFGEGELELLRVIDCLKKTGLEIRDIKRFVDMVQRGRRRTLRERSCSRRARSRPRRRSSACRRRSPW